MKLHSVYGARLFAHPDSDLDEMCGEVTLNHHERWDGQGYPGHLADIFADPVVPGPGKRGEEIPLAARIVALADVYDALVSKRVYKESYPEDQALELIRAETGRQFDPEVVAAFFAIHELIAAISSKYQEESTPPLLSRITP